jgi:dihydroorotate dehydrogenase
LQDFYRLTGGKIPLIGAGGVARAEDAYERICAGASLVQLYTGLVFQGPRLVPDILAGLAALLRRNGFSSAGAAVGSAHRKPADMQDLPQAHRVAG